MVTSPLLNGVTGAYYSGDPLTAEFRPYDASKEAKNTQTGKKLWELSEKLVKKL